jgi:hypothetical protein
MPSFEETNASQANNTPATVGQVFEHVIAVLSRHDQRFQQLFDKLPDIQAQALAKAEEAVDAAFVATRDDIARDADKRIADAAARISVSLNQRVDEQVKSLRALKKASDAEVAALRVIADEARPLIEAMSAKLAEQVIALSDHQRAEVERIVNDERVKFAEAVSGIQLRLAGVFAYGKTYRAGDVVGWRGSSYVAARAGELGEPSAASEDWQVLALRGPAGANATTNLGDVEGTLAVARGGTGANDAAGARTNLDAQQRAIVVAASLQAQLDAFYHNVATATYTDPAGAPVEGRGFTVVVRNGTATVGGDAYAVEGTVIRRIWHSGSYKNQVDLGAVSATATQRGTVPGIGGTDPANAATQSDLTAATPLTVLQFNDGTLDWATVRDWTTATSEFSGDGNLRGVWGSRKVTSIGDNAFFECYGLATANFPSVTSIGNGAFAYTSLTTTNFPLATTIGQSAFASSGLTTTNFPLATSIGAYAFYECYSLTTADFPLATSIGSYAFAYTSLTTADFPLVTTIGNNAFSDCYALTTTNFPSVTTIGAYAFAYSSLTTANFPLVTTVGTGAFIGSSLTTANFPLVTSIEGSAFYECYALTTANFPLVTSIGQGAFEYCTSFTTLYLACPLANVALDAFAESGLTTIYIKAGTVGWTLGSGQTIGGKSGITVAEWTNWPNVP